MLYSKEELIEMYNQIISSNTNISSLTESEFKDLGYKVFHLIWCINETLEKRKFPHDTYISLFNIKDVAIHLMQYPDRLTGDKDKYFKELQFNFNEYHKDILLFLNRT